MSLLLKTFKTTLEYNIGLMGQLLFLNTSGGIIPLFSSYNSALYIEISIKMLEQWRQSVVIMFIPLVADKMVSLVRNLKPLRPETVSWYTRIQSGKGRCPWTSARCFILHYTSPPPSFVHRDNNSIWAEGIGGMSRGDPVTFPTTTLATYGRSSVAWQQV